MKAESVDIASDEQEDALGVQRFVTGSADGKVKIWALEAGEFECVTELTSQGKHEDAVSDVAWRGYNGVMADFIASVSEDETVQVWKCDLPQQPRSSNNQFKRQWSLLWQTKLGGPGASVSWSGVGRMLAVCYTTSDGPVTRIFEQSEHNETDWQPVSEVAAGQDELKDLQPRLD